MVVPERGMDTAGDEGPRMSVGGWSVGLMTGTVLDGNIDVALLRTDGEAVQAFGPWALVRYEPQVLAMLEDALAAAQEWQFAKDEPAVFGEAERALTEAQSSAVRQVVETNGMRMADIDVVGFHGQTVLHRAPTADRLGQTRQLGDGQRMADALGVPVVVDLRSADMAAGGQGAPLAAVYHRALLATLGRTGTAACLNLGGVGNITWAGDDALIAFDTGPGNAPINDWVRQHTGAEMDRDGALAAAGTIDEARLAQLLDHPYLAAPYPKSLDRFDFMASMADGLSLEDGAATLTAFTAATVARGLALLPSRPDAMIVSGGGRRNPTLMREMARRTGLTITDADALGLRGDAIEAEAFALLAARTMRALPNSFPSTTGARHAVVGGRICKPIADV